uniref:beta-galactoside alpha-(2,6)-sialyltransferase n=2 Tax=Tetraselmis sp. GSL018 TaxID=582737 RepID=A0A061S847_9CHLO
MLSQIQGQQAYDLFGDNHLMHIWHKHVRERIKTSLQGLFSYKSPSLQYSYKQLSLVASRTVSRAQRQQNSGLAKSAKTAAWLATLFNACRRHGISSRDMAHLTVHRGNPFFSGPPGQRGTIPRADLPEYVNTRKCAVVGSSPALLGSNLGSKIDEHDTVFRFNAAPTKGFEEDVGKKTTIRLQNSYATGFSEYGEREICLVRLGSLVKPNKNGLTLGHLKSETTGLCICTAFPAV